MRVVVAAMLAVVLTVACPVPPTATVDLLVRDLRATWSGAVVAGLVPAGRSVLSGHKGRGYSLSTVPTANGADVPEWPSEREDRLNQVESEVIEVQRQLAVARRNQDADAVEKLSKQFKELQDERAKILRATGALPE